MFNKRKLLSINISNIRSITLSFFLSLAHRHTHTHISSKQQIYLKDDMNTSGHTRYKFFKKLNYRKYVSTKISFIRNVPLSSQMILFFSYKQLNWGQIFIRPNLSLPSNCFSVSNEHSLKGIPSHSEAKLHRIRSF